jgi:S-adenosylmethionine decarboxylase
MTIHEPAGRHLLAELDQCARLPASGELERLLRRAGVAGGGTVLAVHTHNFGANGGVAGIALLAESHISVHTWPEYSYAAVDVFMCGEAARPEAALDVLVQSFEAENVSVQSIARRAAGVIS